MGPRLRAILCCLLALLPVIFRSVLATPPAHRSTRPGSHNKCKYLRSSSPLLTLPSTALPPPPPLIIAAPPSSIGSTFSRVSLYTDASRMSASSPGSTIYSPSELDRSISDDIVTSGLQQFIFKDRRYCETTAFTTIVEGVN